MFAALATVATESETLTEIAEYLLGDTCDRSRAGAPIDAERLLAEVYATFADVYALERITGETPATREARSMLSQILTIV